MHTQDAQVLFVGGGPAGLAAAIELGMRGIRALLVERNDRVGYAPRSKTTHTRTCEHLRRWGIAGKLRASSPLGVEYPSNMVFVTRLDGFKIATFENAMHCAPGRSPLYSEHAQWVPQYVLERVLHEHAASFRGVTLRFGSEMTSFEQDEGGVHARFRDATTGAETEGQYLYLIGCDGAQSRVRKAIAANMRGETGLSRNYNVIFRAPGLTQANRHGPAVMYWVINDEMPSLLGPMDHEDLWFFMPTYVPRGLSLQEFDVPDLIRKAIGFDLPIEILSSDEWIAHSLIADRYSSGRVFLSGDACHLHPPFGGFGMNMAVHDSVDLGWKMAAVLQGWAGARVLDTYEIERKPVHQLMIDEAVVNHSLAPNQLFRSGIEDDTAVGESIRREIGERIMAVKAREFDTLGLLLGYRYQNSPTVIPDGSAPPPQHFRDYVPSAHPGCRAPHAWLEDGSSLYDHFGQGFTLMSAGDACDNENALTIAAGLGVPFKYLPFPSSQIANLYGARFVLVRPDQHVAWRGNELDHFQNVLNQICGRGA